MLRRIAGFEWDQGNREKCARHGLTIAEIESVFGGEVWIVPDLAHSTRETRLLGIGRTPSGRYVFAAFTLRTRGVEQWIRVISARYMHAKEIRHYQAEIARRKD